jgi:23S rRNA pseudouridine1911/1915/1917 synthase
MNKIAILYEDAYVLVVNKPSGLVVHADGKTDEPTLVDWILETHPEIQGVGEPLRLSDGRVLDRPGIVHRLDRDTSGVMVVAKTSESYEHLKKQFKDREVQKTYRAFVYGKMKDTDGVIDRPIGKSKKDFRLRSAQRGARGAMREAVTEYVVLNAEGDATYVEIKPKTGRTHQIRVHFKAINHSVICDRLYAPKRESLLGFERLALHAFQIFFTNMDGTRIEVEAPLPSDFIEAEGLIKA